MKKRFYRRLWKRNKQESYEKLERLWCRIQHLLWQLLPSPCANTATNVRHHPQRTASGTCRMEISLTCRCPSTGLTGARETAKTAWQDCISLKVSKIIQFYYWDGGEGEKAINYCFAKNHVWKHLKLAYSIYHHDNNSVNRGLLNLHFVPLLCFSYGLFHSAILIS